MAWTPITISPARRNHRIWEAPEMATSSVTEESLRSFCGNPAHDGSWCVRDDRTGAHCRVVFSPYQDASVSWIDGPRALGSGADLAECIAGEAVGCALVDMI